MADFGYVPALHPEFNPLYRPATGKANEELMSKIRAYAESSPTGKMGVSIMLSLLGRYVSGSTENSVATAVTNLEKILSDPNQHDRVQAAIGMVGADYEHDPIADPEKFYQELCQEASIWYKKKISSQKWEFNFNPRPGDKKEETIEPGSADAVVYFFATGESDGNYDQRVELAKQWLKLSNIEKYAKGLATMEQYKDKLPNAYAPIFIETKLKDGTTTLEQTLNVSETVYNALLKDKFGLTVASARSASANNSYISMFYTPEGFQALFAGLVALAKNVPNREFQETIAEMKVPTLEESAAAVELFEHIPKEELMYVLTSNFEVILNGFGESTGMDAFKVMELLPSVMPKVKGKENYVQAAMSGILGLLKNKL